MAYADYGLGLGLAYRHNWEAADRFKIAAIEMGQREKERLFRESEATADRQERENARIAEGNRLASGYTADQPDIPEGYWSKKFRDDLVPRLEHIAEFTSDPNWQMDIKNFEYLNDTKKYIRDHPVAQKVLQTGQMFENAKKEYAEGLLDAPEFAEEQKRYDNFVKNGQDYLYYSRKEVVEDSFKDFFGSVQVGPDYFGSKDEEANADEFYNTHMELINRRFKTLPDYDQKWYKGNPRLWVLEKSRLYTGARQAKEQQEHSRSDSKPTQAEVQWQNAWDKYQNDFVNNNPPPGADQERYIYQNEEVSNFIPVNQKGYYNRDRVALFDDTGQEVKMEVFDTPINGLGPIKRLSSRWRKYKGDAFIETVFKVMINPETELKPKMVEHDPWYQQSHMDPDPTGEKVVATEFFKKMQEKGAVLTIDTKSDKPYYTVKAWAKFNPGQKEIKSYYDNSYGEGVFGDVPDVGSDDEIPEVE